VRKHLASLDGLRGVAALAVVGKHFQNLSHINLHLQQAAVAVDLFFVLSGFVLAQAYEQRLTEGLAWRSYMGMRLARLYPAIFGALVIAVAFRALAGGSFFWQLGFQFLLLPVLFGPILYGGDIFPLDGPQWSLFWELCVNGLHGAIFKWLTPVRLGLIMAIAVLGLAAACAQWGWLDVGWTRRTFWCGLPRVIYGFFAGVLIYRLQQRGWKLPRVPYWAILLILGACMIRWFPHVRLYWLRDFVLVVFILPTIVGFAVNAEAQGRWMKPFVWLGAISYPLYTLHVPLLRGFRWLTIAFPPLNRTEEIVGWWIVLAGVIAFAALFERYYDAPMRTYFARRRGRTQSQGSLGGRQGLATDRRGGAFAESRARAFATHRSRSPDV
jgi:peptidoglycan/LPS O-acetylase OafA/YrhL